MFDSGKIIRVFFNAKECAEILQEEMGIKFSAKTVSNCACGCNKFYHGFQFKHITRSEYEQYKIILNNNEVVYEEKEVC